jgi:hypothetical protein
MKYLLATVAVLALTTAPAAQQNLVPQEDIDAHQASIVGRIVVGVERCGLQLREGALWEIMITAAGIPKETLRHHTARMDAWRQSDGGFCKSTLEIFPDYLRLPSHERSNGNRAR